MKLSTGERVSGRCLHSATRLAYALSLATSDEGREGAQEEAPRQLPKRAETSTPATAQRPWPVPALARAFNPKAEVQSDASSASEQAEEDSCGAAADWLGPKLRVNCDFAVDPYDESRSF